MSVTALIDQYGKDVTLRRIATGRTVTGGVRTQGEILNTVRLLIQNGGGTKGTRYGAERAEYGIVAYAKAGTDIIAADLFDWNGKTYRVETVRIPDERPTADALSYVIVGVTQVEGWT